LSVARVNIRPSAEADVDAALAWYHERDPRLVERMIAELDYVFERIASNPGQFPVVAGPIQRALLHKFPYSVYFVVGGELVAVVAVLHQRRKSIDWGRRNS